MASESVEDTIKKMTCEELIEALKKEIPDERYKADLQILEDENIDEELFLTLPDDPDLKEVFYKLSGGGKAKIRKVVRGIKDGSLKFGRADSNCKRVEPDMPWCTTQIPDDIVNGIRTTTNDSDMQGAWMPRDAVWPWENQKIIDVEFRNVALLATDNWTIGNGQPMNTDTVLRYANTWSDLGGGKIPRFVEAKQGNTPQIRVSFNNRQICNSYLGKRAQNVPIAEPTMNLDLHNGCPSDDYKKHVIIHEFGHALGLAHEHQRSDFWSCISDFIDTKRMMRDLKITDEEEFAAQWKEIDDSEEGHHTEVYDPDSIMHYWFKVEWLTNGYSDKTKVERNRKKGTLTDKVTKALLGIHKRRDVLAGKPSPLDVQLLKKIYGGTKGTKSSGTIEQDYHGTKGTKSGGTIEQDYDEPVVGGPNRRMEVHVPRRRVATDCGDSTDSQTQESSVVVVAKKQKVQPVEEQSELLFEQDYDVEVTNAYLSRMSWTEDGKKQVVRIYDDASHKWHEIGENLGIDPGILVGIGRDGRDERDRVIKVLGQWYENACGLPHYDDYPRTWGGLLKLLDDSDLGQLAKKVQKALLQQKKPSGRVMAGGPPAPANGQNGGQGSGLKAKDLDKVYNAVIGARSKWYHIGLALGIDPGDLDAIKDVNRGNPDGCLTDALMKYLQQVDPRPSWKRLADAMASLSVGRGDIAEYLRKQYC